MEDPERKLFLDKLNQYNRERDVSLSTNPTVSKQPLDLYRLYLAVKSRGGFQDVTKHKLWKEVALSCNLLMNPSMAYTIRKQYIKHLLPFECHFDRGGIDPAVLQSLLENTNRKKSRGSIPSPGSDGRDSSSQGSYPQSGTPGPMDGYTMGNYLSSGYSPPSGVMNSYPPEYNQHLIPPMPNPHGKKIKNVPSPGIIDTNSGSYSQSSNLPNDANYSSHHIGINNYNGPTYSSLPTEYSIHSYPGQQPARQYSPHSIRKKSKGVPSPGSTDSNSQSLFPHSGTPVEGGSSFSVHPSNYSENYHHTSMMNSDYQSTYSPGYPLESRISPHQRKIKAVPSPGLLDGNSEGTNSASNTAGMMDQYNALHSGQITSNNLASSGGNYPNFSDHIRTTSNLSNSLPSINNDSSGNEVLSAQDPFSDEMQPNGPHRGHMSGQLGNRNKLSSPYTNCESNFSSNSPILYFSSSHSKPNSTNEYNENMTDISHENDLKNTDRFNTTQDSQFQHRSLDNSNLANYSNLIPSEPVQKDTLSSAQASEKSISSEQEFNTSSNYDYKRESSRAFELGSRPDGYLPGNTNSPQRMPNNQPNQMNRINYLQRPMGFQQGYLNEYTNEMSNYQNQFIQSHGRLAQRVLVAKIPQQPHSQGPNYARSSGYSDSNSTYRVPMNLNPSSSIGFNANSNLNVSPGSPFMKRHSDFSKANDTNKSYGSVNIPPNFDSRYMGPRSGPPNFGPNGQSQSMWNRDNQYRYRPPNSQIQQGVSLPYFREMSLDQTGRSRNDSNWSTNVNTQGVPSVNNSSSTTINSTNSLDFYNNILLSKSTNSNRKNDPRNLDTKGVYESVVNTSETGSANLKRLLCSSPSLPSGNLFEPINQNNKMKKELGFPVNCVEATVPSLSKKKRLCAKDLPQIDAWRLLMSLKSGLLAESTWALDILIVLANDDNTILYFGLSHLPGLLTNLLDYYKRYLEEIFPHFFSKATSDDIPEEKQSKTKETIKTEILKCENFNNEKTVLLKGANYTLMSRTGKEVKLKSCNGLFINGSEIDSECNINDDMNHIITALENEKPFFRFAKVIDNECVYDKNKENILQLNRNSNKAKEIQNFNKVKGDNKEQSKLKTFKLLDWNEMEEEALSNEDEPLNAMKDYCDSLSSRCICLSTLIRNISFVPGNDMEMRKNSLLLQILSKLLLFEHVHGKKRLNGEKLFINDDSKDEFSENTKNDLMKEGSQDISMTCTDIFKDSWRSETLHVLRENSLVTLANIAGQLDLAPFDEDISYPIIDGLLHWSVCPSSYAIDPLPSTSLGYLSAKRLSLEILVKLSILESNVDLILATRPWSRMQRLLKYLIKLLNRNEEQTLREFGLVLLSNFISADSAIARVMVMYGIVPALIGFIEQSEASALTVANTQGINALRENPELMGTTLDMVRRAAESLRCLSWINENKPVIAIYQSRLLGLVTSQILDQGVACIVSYVIYQCSTLDKSDGDFQSLKDEAIKDERNKNKYEIKDLSEVNNKDAKDMCDLPLKSNMLKKEIYNDSNNKQCKCR